MIDPLELEELVVKCMKCGLCKPACPVFKEVGVESALARGKVRLIKGALRKEIPLTRALADRIYMCLGCRQCFTACPSGVRTDEIVLAARSEFADRIGLPQTMAALRDNVYRSGNIRGEEKAHRTLWTDTLPRETLERAKHAAPEVVYFAGCVASLYPMVYGIPQAFVTLLNKAGVSFQMMGEEEECCGFPLIAAGAVERIKDIASHNVMSIESRAPKTLVTTCPSCYHTWKEEYPRLIGRELNFEVLHSTQYLERLISEGRLKLGHVDMTVTYHDPCDLGRKSGIFDPPRNVLKALPGLKLVELPSSGVSSVCCGGGGNLEMTFPAVQSKIAQRKIRDVLSTGAKTVVSACQQCKRTISTASRSMKAGVKVLDITELVLRSVEAEG
ncbi:MAG TPA: (Fe-S)-binding protein [Firmicutes bacterium]|nr:(Fe-S)-binding protein [Bacillota bacterium]